MRRAAAVVVAGLALILVALLFDASPLFVPGIAITLLGAVAPAWVVARRAGRDDRAQARLRARDRGRADRGHDRGQARALGPAGRGGGRSARRRAGVDPRADVDDLGWHERERSDRRVVPATRAPADRAADADRLGRARARARRAPERVAGAGAARAAAHRAGEVGARGGGEVAARHRRGPDRAVRRHRGRRPSPLPPGHAGVPDPLAGARARGRTARATAASRHRDAPAGRRRRPLPDGPPEHLDAAVRAAASLVLELGTRTGCGLLLPGEFRPLEIEPDLIAWPVAHARLAHDRGRPRDAGSGARSRRPVGPGSVRRGDAARSPARRAWRAPASGPRSWWSRRRWRRSRVTRPASRWPAASGSSSAPAAGCGSARRDHEHAGRGAGAAPAGRRAAPAAGPPRPTIVRSIRLVGVRRARRSTASCAGGR